MHVNKDICLCSHNQDTENVLFTHNRIPLTGLNLQIKFIKIDPLIKSLIVCTLKLKNTIHYSLRTLSKIRKKLTYPLFT
jgi:hypothetical protein